MELASQKTITYLKNKYEFFLKAGLGQNFLVNPSVCPKMAELSGAQDIGVLEIGPGIGVLTKELCEIAQKVVAVEIDERLKPVLKETVGHYDNLNIVFGDVLKLDLLELLSREFAGMDVVVCANLPYYITSPVVMKLLEDKLPIKGITVMVQKEAGARIAATPGTRQAGAISLAVNYYAHPQVLFSVSPGSFSPPPKVHSSVIKLDLYDQAPISLKDEKMFFKVVKAGFGQRRKTLLNALSAGLALPKERLQPVFLQAQIEPNTRAEALSLEGFGHLSNALCELQ